MKIRELLIPAALLLAAMPAFAQTETVLGERAKFQAPPQAKTSAKVQWATLKGGEFLMGTNDKRVRNAQPVHKVVLETFKISKTPITAAQYAECVSAGKCTPPPAALHQPRYGCSWWQPKREENAMNCVSWAQAMQYARYMGGTLPSEAQWEYAAKSGGKRNRYSWGNQPLVDKAHKTMNHAANGSKICAAPWANTEQGLCDMGGGLWEWLTDTFHDSYYGAPVDGRPWLEGGTGRQRRGGWMGGAGAFDWDNTIRTESRNYEYMDEDADGGVTFRVVKQ